MFRKVMPGSEGDVLSFLAREPEVNYFLLGDLEVFTLDDPSVELWMDCEEGHGAVLLRYYAGFLIYAPAGADFAGAARIMLECGFGVLSGCPQYVHPVLEKLAVAPELSVNVFMRLQPGDLHSQDNGARIVRVDERNIDFYVDRLVELRQSISEFSVGLNVIALRDELELGCRRVFIALEGGRAVAMAMTTVERREAAMIVSVCTHPSYRGQGYAGTLVTALCRELEDENKTALLFYNNPVAGRIYRSLGFQDIGRWCHATF